MMMTDLACAPSWKPNDRDRVVVSDRLAADAHGALAIFATDSKSRLEDGRKHQHPGRPRAEFPGPRNLAVKPVERGVDRSVDLAGGCRFRQSVCGKQHAGRDQSDAKGLPRHLKIPLESLIIIVAASYTGRRREAI